MTSCMHDSFRQQRSACIDLMHKIMNFIIVTYNDYMNFINITWRSIGECIGGIGKENGDELLRSGLYESKDSWFFDEVLSVVIGCSGSHRFVTRDFVPDDTHRLSSDHFISGTNF